MKENTVDTIHISVILPVYGVEAYIGDCIASLKAQRLEGLEFIFIDDCSPDRSMAQVEVFAAADPRVRMIRMPENAGPGAARNRGIAEARGEYLSFIDPDDWVDPRFYSLLWAGALAHPNCDIIKGNTIRLEARTGMYTGQWDRVNKKIREQLAQGIPLYVTSFPDHCAALYRAALFEDSSLRYGASQVAEDTTFLLCICLKTQRIAFVDDALYYYRCARPSSITQTFTKKRLTGILQSLEDKIDVLLTHELNEYAYLYLWIRFISTMDRFFFVTQNAPELQACEDRYKARLRSLAAKLPDENMLVRETVEIRILLDHDALIPLSGKQFQCERIRRWTRFIVDHPEAAGQYAEDYAVMLLQSIRMYWADPECELRKEGLFATVTPQWRSLPSGFRRKVLRTFPRMISRKMLDLLRKPFGRKQTHEK